MTQLESIKLILFYPFYLLEYGADYNVGKYFWGIIVKNRDWKLYIGKKLAARSKILVFLSTALLILEIGWIFLIFQSFFTVNFLFFGMFCLSLFYFQIPLILGIVSFVYYLIFIVFYQKILLKLFKKVTKV